MEPRFAIAGGNPSPEEIAAVVAVLAARLGRAGGATAGGAARSGWPDRSRLLRGQLSRGPRAWRASALPR
jgi:hypothetical protein